MYFVKTWTKCVECLDNIKDISNTTMHESKTIRKWFVAHHIAYSKRQFESDWKLNPILIEKRGGWGLPCTNFKILFAFGLNYPQNDFFIKFKRDLNSYVEESNSRIFQANDDKDIDKLLCKFQDKNLLGVPTTRIFFIFKKKEEEEEKKLCKSNHQFQTADHMICNEIII